MCTSFGEALSQPAAGMTVEPIASPIAGQYSGEVKVPSMVSGSDTSDGTYTILPSVFQDAARLLS